MSRAGRALCGYLAKYDINGNSLTMVQCFMLVLMLVRMLILRLGLGFRLRPAHSLQIVMIKFMCVLLVGQPIAGCGASKEASKRGGGGGHAVVAKRLLCASMVGGALSWLNYGLHASAYARDGGTGTCHVMSCPTHPARYFKPISGGLQELMWNHEIV